MSARGLASRAAAPAFFLLAVGAALAGCFSERPPTGPSGATVSFANDIQPVFSGSCAFSGCHGTVNPNPAPTPMVLAAGQAYDNIVNVLAVELSTMARIKPGQPDQSYLIHKLQNTHRGIGGSGERMPLSGTPLPQTTIDMIRTWVTNGALRN